MSRKHAKNHRFTTAIARLLGWNGGVGTDHVCHAEPLEPRLFLSFGDFDRELMGSDVGPGDRFGQAVAVSGDVIATGAFTADLFTGPAQVRSAALDFSTASNPNGSWRYGWRPDGSNGFIAFNQVAPVPNNGSPSWLSSDIGSPYPNVWRNTMGPTPGTVLAT